MATVNGTDYYFIDMQQASGGNITHHLLKDKAGRDAVAPTEASSTASAAHATGSYFFYNGVLYQATADIASGGTITPNTNCKAVTVGGQLGELKSAKTDAYVLIDTPIKNKRIQMNGTVVNANGYECSDFIPCESGMMVKAYASSFYYQGSPVMAVLSFYSDANTSSLISAVSQIDGSSATTSQTGYFTAIAPSGTKFVRFNTNMNDSLWCRLYSIYSWIVSNMESNSIGKLWECANYFAAQPKTFHVNANATHSATEDKIGVDIANGEKFAVIFSRNYSNAIQFYGYDSSNNGTLLDSSYDKYSYKIFTAASALKTIGMTVSLNSSADDYTFAVISEGNALFTALESLKTVTESADSARASVGNIYRTKFTVAANGTHSSIDDKIAVNIPANQPFIYGIEVTDAVDTSLAMFYATKTSDSTTVNFANVYPDRMTNNLFNGSVSDEISSIGVFYQNTANVAVTVSVIVAIGQVEIDDLFSQEHDIPFSAALDSANIKSLLARYADTENAETFTFFSDPHYLLDSGSMTVERISEIYSEWLRQLDIESKAINAQAVICGGDLINSDSTDAQVCYKLAMNNAISKKLFGNKYHLALGNHDSRFDALSQSVIDNMLFAEEDTQKAYYTVKTPKTKFYFLNTGTDQDGGMDSYRWEQMNWLATKLNAESDLNRIVVMHIFSNDASGDPDNFGSGITPMATNTEAIIKAFNTRSTVSVNGTLYDFTDATGKVRCILCGHTHYDTVYSADGIPVICIDDATAIGNNKRLLFDLCFADYENGKLYAYRHRSDSMREVTLA